MGGRVFAGQVLRYARICTHVEDFIDKTRKTLKLLTDRGYSVLQLQFHLEKVLAKHKVFLKFGFTTVRQVSAFIGLCDV